MNSHGLDCLHFPSFPSMTLQLALKVTGVELELISDPNIYLMIESAIRDSLSNVSQRHAKANFPDMLDFRTCCTWTAIHCIARVRPTVYPWAISNF